MSEKRDHERALFAAFLKVEPAFADELIADWLQPANENDFPDIVGRLASGKTFGVEVVEWFNQDEMADATRKESMEDNVLRAIGDQGDNFTQYIKYVWLHPAKHIPERYLDGIFLWPAEKGDQWRQNWITFPMLARAFDQETMRRPLLRSVLGKIQRYGSERVGLDFVALLVVYNRAGIYNSPAETRFHSYEDTVQHLRSVIGENRGPFDRIYLHLALDEATAFLV